MMKTKSSQPNAFLQLLAHRERDRIRPFTAAASRCALLGVVPGQRPPRWVGPQSNRWQALESAPPREPEFSGS